MPQALRLGDSGPEVADLRARLTRLGLLCDDVSDSFDPTVDRAVRHFQQERGLNIDGAVGPSTLRHLEEARWQLGDRALSFTPGHLMRGDDVQALQRRLTSLGFNVGRVDGIFGALTDAALREFQRGVGVDADGTAGVQTFRALDRLDPSHGSDTHGNVVNGLDESVLVAELAARIEGRLAALGTTVLLTRPAGGAAISDADRAAFANETGADLFVSLHLDACTSTDACGVASFHYGVAPDAGWSHSGERAARRIHQAILSAEPMDDCRVQHKTWELLRLTKMPAVSI